MENDFLILRKNGDGSWAEVIPTGKYRFKADGTLQLFNADQNKYHTLTVSGAAGAETMNISDGEV